MGYGGLIYLDHAATGFPKPREVTEEVRRCLTLYGGNPGRGGHRLALAAAKRVFDCRTLAAELFGVDDPARVVFTLNTTAALNLAIKGLVRSGDHVLISDMEHNAVLRPVHRLAKEGKIIYDVFPTLTADVRQSAVRIGAAMARMIRPTTSLVVVSCASNLCSATLPISYLAELCHRRGIRIVVDGAQGAGHIPISVDRMGIDALCLPGHKGLQGPQGCGMLILGRDVLPETLLEGGNGVDSLSEGMSDEAPERYESGTLPTPVVAGLSAGLAWVKERGVEEIGAWERALYRRTREALGNMKGIRLYAPSYEGAVLLFNREGMPAEHVAEALDAQGICVRAGYHCSALGHRTLGTPEGGAVRVSFGAMSRPQHVDRLVNALRRI